MANGLEEAAGAAGLAGVAELELWKLNAGADEVVWLPIWKDVVGVGAGVGAWLVFPLQKSRSLRCACSGNSLGVKPPKSGALCHVLVLSNVQHTAKTVASLGQDIAYPVFVAGLSDNLFSTLR